MSYTFQPNRMYRMPTHFGPLMGPRQGPDGRKFECLDNPKTTTVAVSYLTSANQLEALLPECFTLGQEPVVTVFASYMTEIEWLAGRGYNVLGVTFPAVFKGKIDRVQGPFLTVLWENLADPIITGREELGIAKIYCELPEVRICQGVAHCTASWLGFQFLDIAVTSLARQSNEPVPAADKVDGNLHLKYIPKTGEWGVPDVAYPVFTPAGDNQKTLERWVGEGLVQWHLARWEDMPTTYNIVNALADLEIKQYVGASLVRSVGAKDASDQRILR